MNPHDTTLKAAKALQLKDARDAYHSLMTGTMARVIVDQNGERVEFTAANQTKLAAYISQLEIEIGCGVSPLANLRPAQFYF